MIDMLSVLYNTVYDDHDKMHTIRYNFTDNESYWEMVITMKIH